jgi:hypothetical protein
LLSFFFVGILVRSPPVSQTAEFLPSLFPEQYKVIGSAKTWMFDKALGSVTAAAGQ